MYNNNDEVLTDFERHNKLWEGDDELVNDVNNCDSRWRVESLRTRLDSFLLYFMLKGSSSVGDDSESKILIYSSKTHLKDYILI